MDSEHQISQAKSESFPQPNNTGDKLEINTSQKEQKPVP